MNKIYIYTLIIGLIMLLFVLIGIKELFSEDKNEFISKREKLDKKKLKYMVDKVGNTITHSAKNKTIYKVETTFAQAGFSISYGTYKIIALSVSIILPILTMAFLHNIFLAFVSCFGGYLMPIQIVRSIRNKRLSKLSKQSGSFLNLITERFKATHDLSSCIISSKEDFKGQEPIYSEILKTEAEMKRGISAIEALRNLSVRINSIYIKQFCEYYPIISQIGINKNTLDIMSEPFKNYEKQRKKNEALEKRIQSNIKDNMIMVYAIPIIIIYQSATNKSYLPFMLDTTVGKIGTTIIVLAVIICVWVLVTKLGAPITDGDD